MKPSGSRTNALTGIYVSHDVDVQQYLPGHPLGALAALLQQRLALSQLMQAINNHLGLHKIAQPKGEDAGADPIVRPEGLDALLLQPVPQLELLHLRQVRF